MPRFRVAQTRTIAGCGGPLARRSTSTEYAHSDRDEINRLLAEIRSTFRTRRYETVEELYRRVLTLDEGHSGAWYGLGMLALQRGSLEEAYDCLSEYAALAQEREQAEMAEVMLFFLERLVGGGEELPLEIQEELEERFLVAFSEPGWPDEPLPALDGLTPREAVRTQEGKARVLMVLREKDCFGRALADRLFETRL